MPCDMQDRRSNVKSAKLRQPPPPELVKALKGFSEAGK